MDKVTGMMREEMKSIRDQMGTVTCMSLEGQGVVYLNRRTGGSTGLWRCDIPDSNGVQQSLYIYLGTQETGIHYTHILPLLYLKMTFNRQADNSIHLLHSGLRGQ